MCGIAGIIDRRSPPDCLEAKAESMLDALVHRGPDGSGIWLEPKAGIVLGHRRLSIQDLSENGRQPMFSPSGRYAIVFNGEIYNFRKISSDLSAKGYRFKGHSDTEVLLAAVEEWGLTEAVRRSVGMFAIALWDGRDRTLSLVRDRMGEKPIYYGCLDGAFYFASELRALEKVIARDRLDVDTVSLGDYLKYGYISAPRSIYRGISKLLPGSLLVLPVDDISMDMQPESYWSVFDAAQKGMSEQIQDEKEAVNTLHDLLRRTVSQQMISDVNVGMFLSGGIDSSVVSAVAQDVSDTQVHTYTIGFNEKEYDESAYAERIARHLGTHHTNMYISSGDVLQVVPDIQSVYDEPFADSSQIPTYLVSGLARKHVTVCLSGDGGDELFSGYNRYIYTNHIWSRLDMIPAPMRSMLGSMLGMVGPAFWDNVYRLVASLKNTQSRQKLVGLKVQKLAGLMKQRDLLEAYDYLISYWHNPGVLLQSDWHDAEKANAIPAMNDFINKAMYLDQIGYLPGDNLVKVDRASMAVSLETRLPLLSHEMVELSWRIPVSMKVRGSTSKWALRQVLYRYVPQELIDRPKMGFSVPVAQWLRSDLREWAEDMLATIGSGYAGALQEKPIRDAWQQHLAGKQDHSHRLWTILMFLSWNQAR